ncbi:MAG: ATP-binding protein [Phycisphaeraceae bacterium]|nr:ATP-binding protein [Phycisphaeraceae bacterium]
MSRLRGAVGLTNCDRYFGRVARIALDGDDLRVTVASDFVAGVIDRRFGSALRDAAQGEVGDSLRVTIRVRPEEFDAGPEAQVGGMAASPPGPGAPPGQGDSPDGRPEPPSRYRLDAFVVGRSNALAHSAAMRIVEGEGRFSPLFIHGRCGMGKSHLVHGIAHAYRARHRGARVRCATAEAFTNSFLAAMRENRLDQFRASFREVELLCIDDVHFVASKRATEAELVHTFDAIDVDGKLIVLASDEHPRDIDRLNSALVSRFLAGAVTPLEPPDPELRDRIVRELAARRGLRIEPAALALVAERCEQVASMQGSPVSVRDLEGMVTQIEAAFRLLPDLASPGARIGAALASKALGLSGSGAAAKARRPARIEQIVELVCHSLGVSSAELMGRGRHRRVVAARALCVAIARELTNLSYPEIARAMGRPNHSSVITAHQRLQGQIADGVMLDLGPDNPGVTLPAMLDRLRRELLRRN